jgi:hypothetical protein
VSETKPQKIETKAESPSPKKGARSTPAERKERKNKLSDQKQPAKTPEKVIKVEKAVEKANELDYFKSPSIQRKSSLKKSAKSSNVDSGLQMQVSFGMH